MTHKFKFALLLASFLACCSLFAADLLPIGGFSHVGFRVADLEKTRAFYTGILGFEQAFGQKDPSGKTTLAVFKINDDQFLEFSPGAPAGFTHLAFLTQKLESLRKLVDSLGLSPPELRTGRDRTRNFSIKDPDDHRIEFVQYEADSLQAQARGKFAGDRRISTHLDRVGISTSDRNRAVDFFHGRLGFVESGGLLHPADAPRENVELLPRDQRGQFYLDVPNVANAMRTLHERGLSGDVILDPDGMPIHLK
jgi:lactoylglutathione lyase